MNSPPNAAMKIVNVHLSVLITLFRLVISLNSCICVSLIVLSMLLIFSCSSKSVCTLSSNRSIRSSIVSSCGKYIIPFILLFHQLLC